MRNLDLKERIISFFSIDLKDKNDVVLGGTYDLQFKKYPNLHEIFLINNNSNEKKIVKLN